MNYRLAFIPVVIALLLAGPTCLKSQGSDEGFHLPVIVKDTLPNGLRILCAQINDVPMVEISLIIDAGVDLDPVGKSGTAQAVTQMLKYGTKGFDKNKIDELLTMLGSDVVAYTHYDYAQVYARSLSRNFRSTFEVMSEMISQPSFVEGYLKEVKNSVPIAASDKDLSKSELASKALLNELCGTGNPMSKMLSEQLQGVHALDIEDLRRFYSQYYRPDRTILLVVGNVEARFVRTLAREFLGGWQPAAVTSLQQQSYPMSWTADNITVIPDTGTQIAQYRLGLPALPRGNSRFVAQLVMNELLGNGPESILHTLFWKERRIAPNMSSSIGFSRSCSYIAFAGSAAARMADTVLVLVKEGMRRIRDGEFTQDDIQRTIAVMRRQYAYEFTSDASVMGLLKELALYTGAEEDFNGYLNALTACTRDQIMDVGREILRDDMLRTVIRGDSGQLEERLGRERIRIIPGE